MAEKYRFFHHAHVNAPVAVAWSVFTEHERIGEFTNTPMRIIKPGSPERNGLGCVRRLGTLGWQVDEIVNVWRPFDVYGYHIIDSPMIDAHQGIVRFFPTGEGSCEWVYDQQNIPNQKALDQARGADTSYQNFLGVKFEEYMNDLEAECERRADSGVVPALPPSTSIYALG